MAKYLGKVKFLLRDLNFQMEKISWKDNALADYIAKCASGFIQGIPQDVFLVKKKYQK
jgi:hypothetical protein